MNHSRVHGVLSAWLCLGCIAAAQEKRAATAAVQGVKGVKEDAVATVKHVETGTAASVKPPPVVSAGGTTVPAGGGTVGSGGTIQSVNGVSGINTARLQNLEAALLMKQGGGGTPAGTGSEKGGKGKSAAAALLGPPLGKPDPKTRPKEDGRAGFQEFEKLQNTGS